ncbi:MAG: LptF/LptG family permease [Elusimicrobia bacterium]|nr:LptF/LptG family permease [Elusimicrobiota bacterium]
MKIFSKYICRHLVAYIVLSLMLFTFILLMDKLFQLMNLFMNKGVDLSSVLLLLFYSLPTIFVISMPMAIVTAGILTFGSMASDGEITAVRTSGVSLKPLVLPALTVSVILGSIMVPFNYHVAPGSQYSFRKLFMNIAYKDPILRIEESTLIEIPPFTLMCFKVSQKTKTLGEIIIYKKADDKDPSMSITARSGKWHTSEDGRIILNLSDGTIRHQPDEEPDKLSSIKFDNYSIALRVPRDSKTANKSIESMSGTELRNEINRLKSKGLPVNKISTRYYLRGALAGAIPVMLLVAIPLGIRAESKGKTIGIGLSLGSIAVYYFLMVAGIKLSFNNTVPPLAGVWFPNIVTGIAGALLLYKSYRR